MGCSYRLRPTIGGETAGDGTIATPGGAIEGGKDGAIIEGIIVVDEVGWGRNEKEFKRRMWYYEEGMTGYAG
jgi:hypothetical protein